MEKFEKKMNLIRKLDFVKLDDESYWDEVAENFTPEEIKTMRKSLVDFKRKDGMYKDFSNRFKAKEEYYTRRVISFGAVEQLIRFVREEFFDDAMDYLERKQSEGYISWTGDDEEQYYFERIMGFGETDPRVEYDCSDEPVQYGPKNDPMGGGLGLGYDGEEDEGDGFW